MWKTLLFAAVLVSATAAEAATRDQLVVTPAWLASHAADKDLVVLHVGSADGYAAGHIPGAHLVDAKLFQVSGPELKLEVPPADLLHRQMEGLGISDNSHIVVYNETGEFQRATRVLFTLDVARFGDRSSLPQGHLAPLDMQPKVVTADFVQSHARTPGYDLIDARDAIFYGGMVAKMTGDGHIPGARSLPYTKVFDSDGKLKPAAELKGLFAAAGVKPGDHVVAYCQVGGQSSAVVFAARTVGIEPQLYDGSFEDWSRRKLPVETSNAPGK